MLGGFIKPVYAALIGGTSSGKSTIADLINDTISYLVRPGIVTTINNDMFYRDLAEVVLIQGADRVWDDPNLLDFIAQYNAFIMLSRGEDIKIPYYQKQPGILVFDKMITLRTAPIILSEGFLLHAVRHADGKYSSDGSSITHSGETIEFRAGEPVIPQTSADSQGRLFVPQEHPHIKDTKTHIYNAQFGPGGIFERQKYFVDCAQTEAIFRRLLRDYMEHDRSPEMTLGMWPGVMRTYNSMILPEKSSWTTIDNTLITDEVAGQVYDIAIALLKQASLYQDGQDRSAGIRWVRTRADAYLDGVVDAFYKVSEAKLRRFVQEYPAFRESQKGTDMHSALPESIPGWLHSRI